MNRGIFGVAFNGNEMPALPHVSRGVSTVGTVGRPWAEYVVPEDNFAVRFDDSFMHLRPYHRILSIENKFGRVVNPLHLFSSEWNGWKPDYVGLRFYGGYEDFELYAFHQLDDDNALSVIHDRH